MKKKTIKIEESELKALVFWAEYGVKKACNGSYKKILTIVPRLMKELKMDGRSKKVLNFGEYLDR